MGGAANSTHLSALAADFTCPGFGSPLEVCKKLAGSKMPYDQIIQEGTWVHFAIGAPNKTPRRQILTARFGPKGTTYTIGL